MVTIMDTIVVDKNFTDTVTVDNYMTDTLYLRDTLYLTEYVHDTNMVETIVHDTVINKEYVYITDTVTNTEYIHDTTVVFYMVYTTESQIVVEGVEQQQVVLYDINGRILAAKQDDFGTIRFDIPASGAYLIKVGDYPARKIMVR